MLPARKFDFDTAVGAIGSNERKWNCDDVVLMLERPSEADSDAVDAFLEFFEPPFGKLIYCVHSDGNDDDDDISLFLQCIEFVECIGSFMHKSLFNLTFSHR
jgi:hypothetical protein